MNTNMKAAQQRRVLEVKYVFAPESKDEMHRKHIKVAFPTDIWGQTG